MLDKRNKIINISLIIIIILLLSIIVYLLFTKENEKKLKPSGNVDIFDINCNYNCNCDEFEKENTQPVIGENELEENFDISDNNISWQSTNNLNIFSNPMYDMDNKIAPEASNFYQFVIRNNTTYDVNYNINFFEENISKINMKYRLLKNDEYIIGDENNWVTYEKLNLKDINLTTKKSETYYLEWKWFSSENDTEIGKNENINYSLKIDIKAVQK